MNKLLLLIVLSLVSFNVFSVEVGQLVKNIKSGNLAFIKKVTNEELATGIRDNSGRNALQMAIYHKQSKISLYLIQNQIGIEVPDYTGRTALMMAVTNKRHKIFIQELIKFKASPFHKDRRGRGILFYAKKSKSSDIVKMLKDYRKKLQNIQKISNSDLKKLYSSIGDYNFSGVESFFNKYKTLNVQLAGKENSQDLLLSPKFIQRVGFKKLVKLGINVNYLKKTGETVLLSAIKEKNHDVVNQLLDEEARPDIVNKQKQDGLMLALQHGSPETMIEKLVDATIIWDKVDVNGDTLVHYATKYGNIDLVRQFIKKGAPADQLNKKGVSATLLGAQIKKGDIVTYLIKRKKCSINVADETGKDIVITLAEKDPETYIYLRREFKKKHYDFENKDNTGKSASAYFYENRPDNFNEDLKKPTPGKLPKVDTSEIIIEDNDLYMDELDSKEVDVSTEGVESKKFLDKLIEKTLVVIDQQKKKYVELIYRNARKTDSPTSDELSNKENELNQKQGQLKDARFEYATKLLESKNRKADLEKLEQQKAKVSRQTSEYFKDYAEQRREFIDFINYESERLSEASDLRKEIDSDITKLKNGTDDSSLEEKSLKKDLSELAAKYNSDVESTENSYNESVKRLEQYLENEISSFEALDKELDGYRNEEDKLAKEIAQKKNIRKENERILYSSEHQKIHKSGCVYEKTIESIDKALLGLSKRYESVGADIKSIKSRIKRKREIIGQARKEKNTKLREFKQERDEEKQELQESYNTSKALVEEKLKEVQDQLKHIQNGLAKEADEMNKLVKKEFGNARDVERVWESVRETAEAISSNKIKDKLACYFINGGCVVIDKFYGKRDEYELSDGFLAGYDNKVRAVGFTYNKYRQKSWDRSYINGQITRINSEIDSLQRYSHQIEELQREIELLNQEIAQLKLESKSVSQENGDLKKLISYATIRARALKEEITNGSTNNKTTHAKDLLEKYSIGTFDDHVYHNLSYNISNPQMELDFDILDPMDIDGQDKLTGSAKRNFINVLFSIMDKHDSWNLKVKKSIVLSALDTMLNASKLTNANSVGYSIVTTFGQYLVEANGDLIKYELPDRGHVQFMKMANEVERAFQNARPKTEAGKYSKAMGLAAIELAKIEFKNGNKEEADVMMEISKDLLNIALDLTPGISIGKNVYELIVGKSLVKGTKLEIQDRVFAAIGILSLGSFKFAKMPFKLLSRVISKISKSSGKSGLKVVGKGADVALSKAGKIWGSSRKLGLSKTEDIKDLIKIAKASVGKNADLFTKNIDDYVEAARLKTGPKLLKEIRLDTFKSGKTYNRKLKSDEIFIRYHGVENRTGKQHIYIMKNEYPSEEAMRNGVALLEEWGIKITSKSKIRVPKDTWVVEGLAKRQKGLSTNEIRKGGDYQALIKTPDIPKSWILNTTKAFK